MELLPHAITNFQHFIWNFYKEQGRTFAWRNVENPYAVLVSEIMLQQTQTYRVEPKYEQFMVAMPTLEDLAHASLRDVLGLWQGLGYNRRGKALHETAQKIYHEHAGRVPDDPDVLVTLPGIGPSTAASICAFAYNKPTIFIETNIRAVFIHTFFKEQQLVTDKQLLPLVVQTVDMHNSREWYYALMDYGVHLKKMHTNPSRASAHHTRQSRFEGSDRQIRGLILKYLTEHAHLTEDEIIIRTQKETTRVKTILEQLCDEGFIVINDNNVTIV